jgi:hypothetical protein
MHRTDDFRVLIEKGDVNMMKRFVVAIVLLTAVVIPAVPGYAGEWRTYESSVFDVKFKMPKEWKVQIASGKDFPCIQVSSPDHTSKVIIARFKDQFSSPMKILEYAKQRLFRRLRFDEAESGTQYGMLSLWTEGEGEKKGKEIGVLMLAAWGKKNQFLAYGTAGLEKFDEQQKVMTKILESVAPASWTGEEDEPPSRPEPEKPEPSPSHGSVKMKKYPVRGFRLSFRAPDGWEEEYEREAESRFYIATDPDRGIKLEIVYMIDEAREYESLDQLFRWGRQDLWGNLNFPLPKPVTLGGMKAVKAKVRGIYNDKKVVMFAAAAENPFNVSHKYAICVYAPLSEGLDEKLLENVLLSFKPE